ncbi:MAG: amino acid ABC transporter substrate-binding protein [Desulfobacteraceae bacterium]|nr:amino acid ABC transporter substrate-binding protein [Desulfobacteraceae bacterium]
MCRLKKMSMTVTLIFFILTGYVSITPCDVVAEEKSAKILKLMIRPNKKKDESAEKILKNQLLELVLKKTKEKYGNFTITEYKGQIKQSRVISIIKRGKKFRIIATMTSPEREQHVWPIRIPIYKGLFGYRVFIIREEDQPIYAAINNLEELKKLSAVQGHDWPDCEILESNGFKLYRSPNYRGIFSMLRLKRADYFPRGIHEPWPEVEKHKDKKLAVEKTLLVQYHAPFYFFVRYGDTELHDRIKEGFLMAIKDGSFDELFYNHHETQYLFKQANIGTRKIFRIKNPALSKETPLDKKEWWYNAGDEKRYFHKKK